MANKNLNNTVELSKEVPIFTILNTEEKGKDILILNTNTGYHLIGLDSTTKGEINISFDDEMAHSKKQLMSLLKEINKVYDKAEISYTEKSNPVSSYPAISKTDTTDLYYKGFKVLPEECVKKALDEHGINYDNLKYIVVKLSNDHASLEDAEATYAARMSSPHLTEFEDDLKLQLESGAIQNLGFVGPAGTGKTETVKKLASAMGKNLLIMQGSAGVEVGDLISEFIPDESKPGHFVLKRGILAKAVENGDHALLDELNMMDARVIAGCNSLTDRTGIMTLADGSTIKRHPDFRLYIALNAAYKGTSELNEAFKSRFTWETFFDITKEQYMDWLSIYDFKNTKFLDALYDASRKVKDRFMNSHFETEITFRSSDSFMKNLITAIDSGRSITDTLINRYFNRCFINAAATVDAIHEYELKELTDESKVWCKDIYNAFKEGEDTTTMVGTLKLEQEPSLDDLGDFDSFGDIPLDEAGIPVEEEAA